MVEGNNRKYSDALNIAKEDVLRFLRESGGKANEKDVITEIGETDVARKAINELHKEGLIDFYDDSLKLTEKGFVDADKLYHIHIGDEELFKKLGLDAHKAAHFIEHLRLSPKMLKRLISGKIYRLNEAGRGQKIRIIAMTDARPSIFSRLYGVGLLPGRKIRILSKGYGLLLVEVGFKGRIVAIDEELASRIYVANEAEEE